MEPEGWSGPFRTSRPTVPHGLPGTTHTRPERRPLALHLGRQPACPAHQNEKLQVRVLCCTLNQELWGAKAIQGPVPALREIALQWGQHIPSASHPLGTEDPGEGREEGKRKPERYKGLLWLL